MMTRVPEANTAPTSRGLFSALAIPNWARPLLAAATVLSVLLVGCIDLITGEELSFFVFYFIPVSFAAWNLDRRWATLTAFLCTVSWLGVEWLSNHAYSHVGLLAANATIRWVSYTMMGQFVWKLKQSKVELRDYANELEARVAQRTAKLEERVSEIEMFSYSVSHNLRAPLRAIEGMTHVLYENLNPNADPETSATLARIRSSAARMDRLILDLVEYVELTIREHDLRPTAIEPLLAEVLDVHKEIIKEKGANVSVNSPLPTVHGHNRMIYSVLFHLVRNALKFVEMSRRPQITLRSTCLPNGFVRIAIRDNGIGVDNAYRERIFGLFEQLHSHDAYGGGTGMGLAIARKCILKMGGSIGCDPSQDEGAEFWFELKEYKSGS